MKLTARHTIGAGYIGYATQALAINFAPLLFITFEETFKLSMTKISLLIAISFLTQLSVDGLAAKFSSKINTRYAVVFGQICVASQLIGYALLPSLLTDPFAALVIATVLGGIGGGIIEVLISPIVEACPTKNKSSAMSLLHSFYSWGTAATILFSTLFFAFFKIENWRILSCLWAIVPLIGAIMFALVPIYELEADTEEGRKKARGKSLARSPVFWAFVVMMFCAGAAEQPMIQWASAFAEATLKVEKSLGDMLGPFAFAVFMGATRLFYALASNRIRLQAFMIFSAVLCTLSYLIAAFSPIPLLSLIGCALCGMSVAIMWPGTYSLATENIPFGGVRMFALLALAGDVGCVTGPSMAGFVADAFGGNLKISFVISTLFPILILLLIPFVMLYAKRKKTKREIDSPIK